jgi:exo-beta-1,3-glucanase (GH17 family)
MRRFSLILLVLAALSVPGRAQTPAALRCVAFSPYPAGYDAERGPHPPPGLIAGLLDDTRKRTGLNCIQTYGVLNGLDYIFEAAEARAMTVIAIIWLGLAESENDASITKGIQAALRYPSTIVRLSCGSELRTRHGAAIAEPIIRRCLSRLRAAGVTQPVTSIDTWWSWCNEAWGCATWPLAADVNWIGINIFPWWENKFSGLFPCTTAANSAAFHVQRLQDVMTRYPGKEVILTEFGWPAGPEGYSELNIRTGHRCGIAGAANQRLAVDSTRARLDQLGFPGVLFEAVREPWKNRNEGPVGEFWGVLSPLSVPSNLRVIR